MLAFALFVLFSFVRVIFRHTYPILFDVLESVSWVPPAAAVGIGVAIQDFLHREFHPFVELNAVVGLNGVKSRDDVAGAAKALVVHWVQILLPVLDSWQFSQKPFLLLGTWQLVPVEAAQAPAFFSSLSLPFPLLDSFRPFLFLFDSDNFFIDCVKLLVLFFAQKGELVEFCCESVFLFYFPGRAKKQTFESAGLIRLDSLAQFF